MNDQNDHFGLHLSKKINDEALVLTVWKILREKAGLCEQDTATFCIEVLISGDKYARSINCPPMGYNWRQYQAIWSICSHRLLSFVDELDSKWGIIVNNHHYYCSSLMFSKHQSHLELVHSYNTLSIVYHISCTYCRNGLLLFNVCTFLLHLLCFQKEEKINSTNNRSIHFGCNMWALNCLTKSGRECESGAKVVEIIAYKYTYGVLLSQARNAYLYLHTNPWHLNLVSVVISFLSLSHFLRPWW